MNSLTPSWDAIIVGAGAAGLMAAASAAARGRKVLLLEKNRKLGVKILMSGGTRCNITHACDAREIATAFGDQGKFLHSALAALPPDEVVRKIESQGVLTKVEATGKIFPVSDRAIDVRDALVQLASDAGAIICQEQPVRDIERLTSTTAAEPESSALFRIHTDQRQFDCHSLLITTGGKSYPGCGTTGDGYLWAEKFGHTIVRPVPALTPITCNQPWVNDMKGVTMDDVKIEIWNTDDLATHVTGTKRKAKPIDARRGSLLFTHFGFSGPPALDISRAITRRSSPAGLVLQCDFLPTTRDDELVESWKRHAVTEGKLTIANWLARLVPRRVAEALVTEADIPQQQKLAELSKLQVQELVKAVKQQRLPVSGTLGFKKAEVTAGGVSLAEVNSRNMESKLVANLFFAGEILDLDGPIGGFNFQSAFSTGWLAGQHL